MKNSASVSYLLFLLFTLWSGGLAPQTAQAQEWSQWRFYADTTVAPQADDSFDAVYVDFTRLMRRDLKQEGALDENSIRVAPLENGKPGAAVPSRFIKAAKYNAAQNAVGTVIFQVVGAAPDLRQYRVFFDAQSDNSRPALKMETAVPAMPNMIWNGSFEILSQSYQGANRYANTGSNMPRGWWGNLRNLSNNAATSAYSGEHALALAPAQADKNSSILAAPSPPALRVVPGQNYTFSFRAKGESLTPSRTILIASVYWFGEDEKSLARERITNLPQNFSDFPWMKAEVTLPAPLDARYGAVRIGTYSPTGLVTIDDLEAYPAIAPLLENARVNQ